MNGRKAPIATSICTAAICASRSQSSSCISGSGDSALDHKRQRLAQCFDADIVVGFGPEHLENPGRPPTGCARIGMTSVMSEAGSNGLLDEDSIAFHVNGVLNIARLLGMRDDEPHVSDPAPTAVP